MRFLTIELIEAIATSGCGWSKETCRMMNIPWPLKKGWKQRHAGQEISELQHSWILNAIAVKEHNPDQTRKMEW